MDNNYLGHSGIKGQKWGVRRYQNKDGTLTPAGKKRRKADYQSEAKKLSDQELRAKIDRMNLEKRYYNATRGMSGDTNAFDVAGKGASTAASAGNVTSNAYKLAGKNATKISATTQGLAGVSSGMSLGKKAYNISKDKKAAKRSKEALKDMNDKDLTDLVKRMELEQQYVNLSKEKTKRGKVSAMQVLEVIGDVLVIGGSATAIALAVRNAKKGT